MTATDDLHLVDLASMGLLAVEGIDAENFLQSLTCNDVTLLSSPIAQYNGICTPQGRMLASFLLCKADDGFLLQLPQSMLEICRRRLSMYILRSKVSLTDVSARYRRIGVYGSSAAWLLANKYGPVAQDRMAVTRSNDAMIICHAKDRFELLCASESWQAGEDEALWEYREIADGIPLVYPQTSGHFVPQMLNFELIGGVSFKKGCYPGQEIVARSQYLGKVKRRMFRARIAAAAQPGEALYCGDEAAGEVLRIAPSPAGGYDILAVLSVTEAQNCRLESGIMLQLLPLPYSLP